MQAHFPLNKRPFFKIYLWSIFQNSFRIFRCFVVFYYFFAKQYNKFWIFFINFKIETLFFQNLSSGIFASQNPNEVKIFQIAKFKMVNPKPRTRNSKIGRTPWIFGNRKMFTSDWNSIVEKNSGKLRKFWTRGIIYARKN